MGLGLWKISPPLLLRSPNFYSLKPVLGIPEGLGGVAGCVGSGKMYLIVYEPLRQEERGRRKASLAYTNTPFPRNKLSRSIIHHNPENTCGCSISKSNYFPLYDEPLLHL